jgi:hypothetical protein
MTFLFEMIFWGFFFLLSNDWQLHLLSDDVEDEFFPSPPVTSHFSTPESPGNNDAI